MLRPRYYCVEEQSAFFNGSTVDVCSEWGKDITVGTAAIGTDNSTNSTEAGQRKRRTIDNGSAKNGNERFDGVDAKEHREFVGFSALAGFILVRFWHAVLSCCSPFGLVCWYVGMLVCWYVGMWVCWYVGPQQLHV